MVVTNDVLNKDAWFVGFSPDLTVGVYVGYDRPRNLGYKQTGSAVAVPIFKKFMEAANINTQKIPFRIPPGLSFVKIDPIDGTDGAVVCQNWPRRWDRVCPYLSKLSPPMGSISARKGSIMIHMRI